MSRSKNAKAGFDPTVSEALSEYFVDGDNVDKFDGGLIEYASFGRILSAVASMGGSISFYSRDGSNGIKLFVRIGERSRSYTFDSEDEWNELIESVANPWLLAHRKFLELKQPTKPIAIATEKSSKPSKE